MCAISTDGVAVVASLCLVFFLYSIFAWVKFRRNAHVSSRQTPSRTPGAVKCDLSVVIPVYNELGRIEKMLSEVHAHLTHKQEIDPLFTYEIIIVDDGSTDGTGDFVRGLGVDNLGVTTFAQNMGKGRAVKEGLMSSNGCYVMYCDADGATPFSEVDKLLSVMDTSAGHGFLPDVAYGVRSDRHNSSCARRFLGLAFRSIVSFIVQDWNIGDTQCGFKMFSEASVSHVVRRQILDGWAFDVELLFLSIRGGALIVPVPVAWSDVEGGKVNALVAPFQMLRDVIFMRTFHGLSTCKMFMSDSRRPSCM